MWRGGRSITRRGGGGNRDDERKRRATSDEERNKRVASDAGRKRGSRKWTNIGLTPPPAFFHREVEEYDRRFEHGSSSGSQLPPPKIEPQDDAPRAGRAGLLPGDFVDDDNLPWITADVLERSKQEEEDHAERRRMTEELDELRFRKALHDSLHVVVDLVSDSD